MLQSRFRSIRENLAQTPHAGTHSLSNQQREVAIDQLRCNTSLGGHLRKLNGRCVLVTTHDQLAAALVMIELDGIASRIVICPPDIRQDYFPAVIEKCGVDAVVSNTELNLPCTANLLRVKCGAAILPSDADALDRRETEWILLTSGTTGAPKMIAHTLETLTAPIDMKSNSMIPGQGTGVVWGTFYDIRRYGGMQIFLRAVLGSGSLVLSAAGEPIADHLTRLGSHAVTHLSGTPSHWRRALMSPQITAIAPKYVRLSGEIANQAILDALAAQFPDATISHAFASTEAGVAFEVTDGLSGFPTSFLGKRGDVEMRVVNDALQIRSTRTAFRYMDGENGVIRDTAGWVDTGDIVHQAGDRLHFLGRKNGVINVGGLKVFPEEVEAVINRHPAVRMSMVKPRKNAISGALVAADVVLKNPEDAALGYKDEILEICRQHLEPHKVPVTIRWVDSLEVAAAGKLARGEKLGSNE